jgi:predicted nuclease of predicted toxin-antitoxin system
VIRGFYMDEQVPSAITRALRRRGLDILTVQDDGMAAQPDSEILARSIVLDRVLFTRDKDFLREGARLLREGTSFPGIIYAHTDKVSHAACIEELALMDAAGSDSDLRERIIHLPLR